MGKQRFMILSWVTVREVSDFFVTKYLPCSLNLTPYCYELKIIERYFTFDLYSYSSFHLLQKRVFLQNCKDSNKPPIANAGRDTIIFFPKDRAMAVLLPIPMALSFPISGQRL